MQAGHNYDIKATPGYPTIPITVDKQLPANPLDGHKLILPCTRKPLQAWPALFPGVLTKQVSNINRTSTYFNPHTGGQTLQSYRNPIYGLRWE